MTQRKIEYWVIPPQADAEFVAHMEQVLDLYQKPYDPNCPVVCMDEQPVQLVQETRPPMAATKNRPRRVDYEYETGRHGRGLPVQRAAGGLARRATAGPIVRRWTGRWRSPACCGRRLPEDPLVCDHLNTHTKGAFYEGSSGTERELVRRIECHTPTRELYWHRENELSSDAPMCAGAAGDGTLRVDEAAACVQEWHGRGVAGK